MPAPESAPPAPRSDAELSEFLMRACHDMRGPLRAVRIHAEIFARNRTAGESEECERALTHIVSGATIAGSVVDGISDYALALAIDSSRFQPWPLDILLRSAIAKLAEPIRESNAEVVYGELPTVMGDGDRLLQLFEYLLDHSLRRRGGNRPRIRVSAEHQDSDWLLRVSDNCAPLEEPLERAFTPFARLHKDQRPGPGLAVCRAIVERHCGSMIAEPCADGCMLRFTLPGG